ncbi:hypothetical protein HZ994_06605 [Akkermansiaceae bacterium]|nr:hypothetical protein HZ994_06605 [Akkermansiaceae bacterium]
MKLSKCLLTLVPMALCGLLPAQTISRPPLVPLIPSLHDIPGYMDNKDHVFIYERDGKLQTGIYERHAQPLIVGQPIPPGDPVNIRTQWRIFEGELFHTTDFNGNPACRSDRPGWANDPSELLDDYSLTPGSSIGITALAFEIDGKRGNLFYWDGNGDTPKFGQAPQGLLMQLWNQDMVYPQKSLLDGSDEDRQGPELARVEPSGKFKGHHAHRDFSIVEIPVGQKVPEGIFLIKFSVRSSAVGVAPADPIYWILNLGLASEKRVAASEWVHRNLVPAPQKAAIAATKVMNPPDPNATSCNCQGTICKKTGAPKSEGGYTEPATDTKDGTRQGGGQE